MDLINISTNWLSEKSLKSCLFVRHLEPMSEQSLSSETGEDIETLLENYENCLQLCKRNDNTEESDISCKLSIDLKVKQNSDNNETIGSEIHSFSILCSVKTIELHGSHRQYITTLNNEFIDETECLSMFRNDYKFCEPQEEICLTFKGSKNDLWIYGLLLNIRKAKQRVMPSTGSSSIASIMNIMSMFGNSMKSIGSSSKQHLENDLINKFSKLMSSKESPNLEEIEDKCLQQRVNESTDEIHSLRSDIMSKSEYNSSISDSISQYESESKCFSRQNSTELRELREYIDKKFSDLETSLETSIDNKFIALENKIISILSLYLNK